MQIRYISSKVHIAVRIDLDVLIIKLIFKIDNYYALDTSSEIIDIERFNDFHKIYACMGFVV